MLKAMSRRPTFSAFASSSSGRSGGAARLREAEHAGGRGQGAEHVAGAGGVSEEDSDSDADGDEVDDLASGCSDGDDALERDE